MRTAFSFFAPVTAAVILAAVATPAAAQTVSADRILKSFSGCRTMTDPTQKLACFDRTVDEFTKEVKTNSIKIVDRKDINEAKRSLFGFMLPKIDLFGGARDADKGEGFTVINTTVAAARTVDNGHAEITLADGSHAVWRTTDPVDWLPKAGAKVKIEQGVLNNYFLSTEGRSYRALRLR